MACAVKQVVRKRPVRSRGTASWVEAQRLLTGGEQSPLEKHRFLWAQLEDERAVIAQAAVGLPSAQLIIGESSKLTDIGALRPSAALRH
jgi:hypothetical protein